jgi:hypothetical protein
MKKAPVHTFRKKMNWRHLLVPSFLFKRDQAAGTVARETPL